MNFCRVDSSDDVADHVMQRIRHWLTLKDAPVFALPAGATPILLYRKLVEAVVKADFPLARARLFALDEWWGEAVPPAATFRQFLLEQLLAPAGIPQGQLFSLPSWGDATTAAAAYEEKILEVGGIDLAILGIGSNGHIAFNEPGTPAESRTGLRVLAEKTRQANGYLFPGETSVPTHGLTIGIGTLMAAREVLLMASGPGKQRVIKQLQESAAGSELPASALKQHSGATVVVDDIAGALL